MMNEAVRLEVNVLGESERDTVAPILSSEEREWARAKRMNVPTEWRGAFARARARRGQPRNEAE
jgi:hypothetical protein